MQWLETAKTLAVSRKTRIDCDCGDGKTGIVNHEPHGYSFFCFRCGEKFFESKGKQTLAELAYIKQLNEEATNEHYTIELPADLSDELPLAGRLWLYRAGITPTTWKQYGFGYSEKMQRVVMPVYDERNQLVWWQARAVHDGQEPKYLNPTGDRSRLMFWAGKTTSRRIITVVEDILSALRVGFNTPACSMLGTKITTQQANMLCEYEHVRTWLDPDRAGKQGAYNIRKACGLVSKVSNIRTERDPKEYSNAEILEILEEQ